MPLKLNCRRLRGYAFDPSLSLQVDTALVNETIFEVRWENLVSPGGVDDEENSEEVGWGHPLGKYPVGEYLEIVDYDPASKCFYEPVNLNDRLVLAQDGIRPSESDPRFHQQMVYAVAMTTIQNFEKALGRQALWGERKKVYGEERYVQRLRIYPHALREANAFYSPDKVALLFGYFSASSDSPDRLFPGGIIFTCLSHDIIAHETTHALLDGMHQRYIESSHPDGLAFHEAFADIVALFQHFTFPGVLRHQIAKTKGNLSEQNMLGKLAQEFGQAIGQYGALRDAIGGINPETKVWELKKPHPDDYTNVLEPHARGSILVAAIFDAFLTIYKSRVADLLRIATSGTGKLPDGEIHPDLVNRLADEAAKSAKQVLGMCIRALDYCPPADITFGDYLRAIITADVDLVPEDDRHYRVAFIEAFRRRGIYPRDIRNLSVDSLSWERVKQEDDAKLFAKLGKQNVKELEKEINDDATKADMISKELKEGDTFRQFMGKMDYMKDRRKIFLMTADAKRLIREMIVKEIDEAPDEDWLDDFERLTGLVISMKRNPKEYPIDSSKNEGLCDFEVHSLKGARRVGPDGVLSNQLIITITQERKIKVDGTEEGKIKGDDTQERKIKDDDCDFVFRGGCTFILDLEDLTVRYVIKGKRIDDEERLKRHKKYRQDMDRSSLRATYFGVGAKNEPFAMLHRGI